MSKTLDKSAPAAHVAEIAYHADKLMLPNGMDIPDAIKLLKERQEFLQTKVDMMETFNVFPWDGANALEAVLTKKFGWAAARSTPGMWGPTPPKLISIAIGPNKKKQVPWGAFGMPGVEGMIGTGVSWEGNRLVFRLTASVQRKDEATIRELFEDVRAYLAENSIYRGKAIKIRFKDDDGDDLQMPEPSFIETGKLRPEHLIYSADVQAAIETNLFTPITRVRDCLANKMPVKRGVLLGGIYGTGKTLAATVASTLAVEAGVTYLYTPRADELAKAIEFAKQYQTPACVVFCEDIDRVMDGERDVEMDDILNIIDGIDTKDANIITVLTTNALRGINPAMLRPGRLDAVIEVTAPDAEAVTRLLRLYGRENISPDADLTAVGEELQGCIPAVVAEVVKRAKLAQLRLQEPGEPVKVLSEAALLESAKTMRAQIKLLNDASEPKLPELTIDARMEELIARVVSNPAEAIEQIEQRVKAIAQRV